MDTFKALTVHHDEPKPSKKPEPADGNKAGHRVEIKLTTSITLDRKYLDHSTV